MAYVPIPKDLTKVKTKFALGLTKRQLIFFGAGAAIGIPLFFLIQGVVPTSTAAFLMILVMLPCFMFAIYEKHGQPLETVLKNIIQTKFIRPKVRIYQTDNLYTATARQAQLYKEVRAVVKEKTTAPKGKKTGKKINRSRKKAD